MDVMSFARMSYVLEQTKQQQVLALGQLGWTVSRIAAAVRVDRATVTRYLRGAGLPVRGRGRPSEGTANAAILGHEVSTDPRAHEPHGVRTHFVHHFAKRDEIAGAF